MPAGRALAPSRPPAGRGLGLRSGREGSATGGWEVVPRPDPGLANGGNTILDGVAAFGSDDLWAVGTYGNGAWMP